MDDRVYFELTVEGLRAQAEYWLAAWSLPVNERTVRLFGGYVQILPDAQNWFEPSEAKAVITKAMATESAFYLIHPDRYEQQEEATESEDSDSEVVQETGTGGI